MRSRPQTSLSAPALALTLALLAVLTLLPGCSDRLRPETGGPCGGTAILHFGLEAYADTAVRSASPAEEARLPLSALYYAVADPQGRIIALPHARLESDCSKLTIEGLSAGDYRIAVLATTAADSPVESGP